MSTNNNQLDNLTNQLRSLKLNSNIKKHGTKCKLSNNKKNIKYGYDINNNVDLICKKSKKIFGRKLKSSLKKKNGTRSLGKYGKILENKKCMTGPCWHKLSSMNKRKKSYKKWKNLLNKKITGTTILQAQVRGKQTRNNLQETKNSELINLTSNRIYKARNIRIDISNKTLTNIKDASVDIISKPDNSASNSVVFKITDTNTKFIYILKVMLDTDDDDISFKTEEENYKTMKNILSKRLTPHVFTFIDSKILTPTEISGKSLFKILKTIRRPKINFTTIRKYYLLLTETSDHHLMTLYDFLSINKKNMTDHILFNILFQIMYTLYIFNKLKIKHNDLHFGNIMVSIANRNILNTDRTYVIKYNNIYHFDKKRVCLPNIGISVRIFDFDRTTKAVTDSYGKETCNTIIQRYMRKVQNCDENKYFDTYKVLFHLYKYSFNINDWIKSLFGNKDYIMDPSTKSGEMDNNYGFLYTGVDATMKTTKEILEQIVTKIEQVPEFTLRGKKFSYYNPKRYISGEYHEDGMNSIISIYEEQKEQKKQKKSQKELNNNIIAFQQQLTEENNE